MLLGLLLAFMPLAAAPEQEGVSSRQVAAWIDSCEREIDCLHGFVFLRHGKVIAEGSWKPYDTLNETHFLSSHTKCFITTAVGMLVDEGNLDLDEPILDILADKAPAEPSEGLRRVRVRDLLTMNFGASPPERWSVDRDGDWIRLILAHSSVSRPGASFAYDSSATHLLGEIVARRSGKPLMDFLRTRLFAPLGIEKAWTSCAPTGEPCAAWGFNMTTREISLIGQLYLNGGAWNGRQLVSRDWVTLATAKQTWSGKTPKERQPENDWVQGFGFNWWLCQHGCLRADGSGGQYTIIFPQHDAVLSIHADVNDMQQVLNVVWRDFLPVFSPTALPADATGAAALKAKCANLALRPVAGRADGVNAAFCGRDFLLKDAPGCLRGVRLDPAKEGWSLTLTTDAGAFAVPVGFGAWKRGEMRFSTRKHEALGDVVGLRRVAASGAVQPNRSFKVRVHLLEGTHKIDLVFRRALFKTVVEGDMVGLGSFKGTAQ